jgi:hypothetical protein
VNRLVDTMREWELGNTQCITQGKSVCTDRHSGEPKTRAFKPGTEAFHDGLG